jgi:mRNA-degrading endonuclease toxin of MazEF toxin-antitoxin module
MCDFDQHPDSRQNGIRPAIVIQTDLLNRVANYYLTIVLPCCTKGSEKIPSHAAVVPDGINGLSTVTFVKCEQIQTLPTSHLVEQKGILADEDLTRVEGALRKTLGL